MTCTGKNTKTEAESQLKDLLESGSESLLAEILTIGLQQLMELERDHHIEADPYERSDQRRSSRNGYKPRQLYTRVGTLHLRVPQTRDGEFYPSILERYQRSEKALVADWLSEQAEQTLTVFQVAPRTHRRRVRTTNAVERLHQELKRRSKPVRIFPNPQSCLRLFGAMLKEQHEDWITGRRYLKMKQLEEFKKKRTSSSEDPPKKIHQPAMAE